MALLTELELAPAHIVGNSAGAIIALKLTTYRPSAIRSLMIHEPPLLNLALDDPNVTDIIRDGTKRVEAIVEVLQRGDIEGGARQFVETIAFGPGAWEKLPTQLRETFVTNAGTWLDELKDPAGLSVDLKTLSQFRKPTLVSYGGHSAPFFRPIVQKLVDTIPGSTIGGYPEDGHTPHISNPDEFVPRITAFARSSS